MLGEEIRATVGSVNGRAIITELDLDMEIVPGGEAEGGGYTIQMLMSDFGTAPVKGATVTANGVALGKTLELISHRANNGIYYIVAGNFAAPENA